MLRAIDHIVILVRDLAQASADYERAGFTVTPGGTHAAGTTHNALISFADGTYFELIAFFEPDRPQEHRWWSRGAQGDGLVDYALLSSDLAADCAAMRSHGLQPQGPEDGGRLRPDGERLVWRSAMLGRGNSYPALPFVIEDVTPRDLRVPGGDATRHRLPVTRVTGLTVVTADLAAGADALAALLGTAGESVNTAEGAGQRFTIGRQWLLLLQPSASSDAGQHLAARGEGPYEIALSGESGASSGQGELLPVDQTHGARIRVAR
ncbi:MAG: VOC family protein [Thermomicrobiales bacterium]